ncbi:toxin-antitoxin system YwqK family antitoxin [Parapedobacter tibetensis]|uniref:toxin-antitoxin system YwqK family antitoxin n=1 Tax=Parapedobacter tibetensis TaxID=2972951 RepID=UPI00214DB2DF|nr:hypothetical protein [Parapedobacter tibetensis]
MKVHLLIAIWLVAASTVFADGLDTVIYEPVYYEAAPNGMTRFFYDDNYYLADKNCQFKAIERVGRYDFQLQTFVGEFTDFNNQGTTILRGNYRDGRKEGEFKAYHPNGQLKWEVSYLQNIPQEKWKFYYPDGKPLLEAAYDVQGMWIYNFWDNRGRQRVTNGNGRYEFAIRTDDYNEFGYVRYNRKGRVVAGRPHGDWIIEYIFDNNKKVGAGHEHYRNGQFISGYEAFKDETFDKEPRYQLVPFDVFRRAESMIGKSCTIDEYTGFTNYLRKHLEEWFEGEMDEVLEPQKIEFVISVSKTGEPQKIEPISTFPNKIQASSLLNAFRWVGFWFPSYADGEYIDDILIVTMEVFPNIAERKLRFFDVNIQRTKGF